MTTIRRIFILMMFVIFVRTALSETTMQPSDYHEMARELGVSITAELAQLPEEQKAAHRGLAKDLTAKITLGTQDKKDLLELNKTILQASSDYASVQLATQGLVLGKPIYIFVSSSMVKRNLINLGKDAASRGAKLVMRGFIDNSYMKTVSFLKEVIDKTGQGVIIDSSLFEIYEITEVPSFVAADGNLYDKLNGNVSLSYALSEMESKGEVFNRKSKDEVK